MDGKKKELKGSAKKWTTTIDATLSKSRYQKLHNNMFDEKFDSL